MSSTAVDVLTISPLTHEEAMQLQEHELETTLRALRSLSSADWASNTDCPGWDVSAMYRHVLGACEAGASMRENVHQLRRARAHRRHHGGPLESALSAVQVSERSRLTPAQLVERLTAVAPKTVRGRTRVPAVVRARAHLKVDGPVFESWAVGYLIDTVYLRDLWMHRVDLHRAVGSTLELCAGHDGRIVADVVAEWARRHGAGFELELTGAAGGTFVKVQAHDRSGRIALDAVEFCRTLAGRAPATGLLETVIPF